MGMSLTTSIQSNSSWWAGVTPGSSGAWRVQGWVQMYPIGSYQGPLSCNAASVDYYLSNIDGDLVIFDGGAPVSLGVPIVSGDWYYQEIESDAVSGIRVSIWDHDLTLLHRSTRAGTLPSLSRVDIFNTYALSADNKIRSVRIWADVAASDAQILAEAVSPTVVDSTDIVAAYDLDSLTGLGTDTTGGGHTLSMGGTALEASTSPYPFATPSNSFFGVSP